MWLWRRLGIEVSDSMSLFRYTNPVITDPTLSLRDPCIVKDGGRWWLTGTSQPVWGGQNPGVRLLVSDDLLKWEHHSWIVDAEKLPADCFFNGRFWAPEIHRAHGKFWLTVASGHEGPEHGERRMDGHHIVLFRADRIDGPYELVTREGPLGQGFKNDASLFTDGDGCSYLYCSGGGLWQARIDLKQGRLIGEMEKILGPRDEGNPEWMIGGIEGPFVIRRHGFYWMFFAAWTRGYETGLLRAEHPLGPWTLARAEPLFGTRKRHYREAQMIEGGYAHLEFEDTPDPFVEVGHGCVFEGPDGNDWFCAHYFAEGREPVAGSPVPEWHDSVPQLGIEPILAKESGFEIAGPTWTERLVEIS